MWADTSDASALSVSPRSLSFMRSIVQNISRWFSAGDVEGGTRMKNVQMLLVLLIIIHVCIALVRRRFAYFMAVVRGLNRTVSTTVFHMWMKNRECCWRISWLKVSTMVKIEYIHILHLTCVTKLKKLHSPSLNYSTWLKIW